MKKTVFKALTTAVLICLALLIATCDDWVLPGLNKDDEVEYLDWQYEELPDGKALMTVTLDGSTPFPHKAGRALSKELAQMSHDYFEVVFFDGVNVARASWEIGEPAGISGVKRGEDYGPVYSTSGTASSVIFVGKKTGKTLLGIGHLLWYNENGSTGVPASISQTISTNATSVTFGVYPLKTGVGISTTSSAAIVRPNPPGPGEETFLTATGTDVSVTGDLSGPTAAKTIGSNPSLRGGVEFPLFTLPDAINGRTIEASYKISGLGSLTPGDFGGVNKPDLWDSARIIQGLDSEGNTIGLQIIRRVPSYVAGGQTFDARGAIDTYTKVAATNNQTPAGGAFNPLITMLFTQHTQSTGIFAITFQCPVYAITTATAANGGGGFTRWYVRPGYQQYQYLLDNGIDAGGAVFLGTTAGDVDWLDIFTLGVGFDN